jgi:hypothetical protein
MRAGHPASVHWRPSCSHSSAVISKRRSSLADESPIKTTLVRIRKCYLAAIGETHDLVAAARLKSLQSSKTQAAINSRRLIGFGIHLARV